MARQIERQIEKARSLAAKIATRHSVPVSAVVWAGKFNFFVVKNGKSFFVRSDKNA